MGKDRFVEEMPVVGSKEASSWPLHFLKKEGNLNNMNGEGEGRT